MDFKKLDELVAQKYLRRVEDNGLVLYNYTDICTYENHWTPETLASRGTVYDIKTGKINAQAFPKFFNFGELSEELQNHLLEQTDFEVFEKMDGSLGIVYYHDGEWRINTRGSFSSDQAAYAQKHLLPLYDLDEIAHDVTLLVEIIYPENRIIVNYQDKEQLVLLGGYQKGRDLYTETLEFIAKRAGMSMAKSYKFDSVTKLIDSQNELPASEEGYVANFNGMRVKFKSPEYLRIARIKSNSGPLALWEKFSDTNFGDIEVDFLESLPEELREDVEQLIIDLEHDYGTVWHDIFVDHSRKTKKINAKRNRSWYKKQDFKA